MYETLLEKSRARLISCGDLSFRPETSLGDGIYEVRTNLKQNRIARVLFYIGKMGRMVLLHGFIKKTQKTMDEDLELARNNQRKHKKGLP